MNLGMESSLYEQEKMYLHVRLSQKKSAGTASQPTQTNTAVGLGPFAWSHSCRRNLSSGSKSLEDKITVQVVLLGRMGDRSQGAWYSEARTATRKGDVLAGFVTCDSTCYSRQ